MARAGLYSRIDANPAFKSPVDKRVVTTDEEMKAVLAALIVLLIGALISMLSCSKRPILSAGHSTAPSEDENPQSERFRAIPADVRPPNATISGMPIASSEASNLSRVTDASTVFSDVIVYGENVKLKVAGGITVSSPTGVMVSNVNQSMIAGDLLIEGVTGTVKDGRAVVDVARRTIVVEGAKFIPREGPAEGVKPE